MRGPSQSRSSFAGAPRPPSTGRTGPVGRTRGAPGWLRGMREGQTSPCSSPRPNGTMLGRSPTSWARPSRIRWRGAPSRRPPTPSTARAGQGRRSLRSTTVGGEPSRMQSGGAGAPRGTAEEAPGGSPPRRPPRRATPRKPSGPHQGPRFRHHPRRTSPVRAWTPRGRARGLRNPPRPRAPWPRGAWAPEETPGGARLGTSSGPPRRPGPPEAGRIGAPLRRNRGHWIPP